MLPAANPATASARRRRPSTGSFSQSLIVEEMRLVAELRKGLANGRRSSLAASAPRAASTTGSPARFRRPAGAETAVSIRWMQAAQWMSGTARFVCLSRRPDPGWRARVRRRSSPSRRRPRSRAPSPSPARSSSSHLSVAHENTADIAKRARPPGVGLDLDDPGSVRDRVLGRKAASCLPVEPHARSRRPRRPDGGNERRRRRA